MDIFSKSSADIGETVLVKMTLIPKSIIKPLDKKPHTLCLKHHALLRKELRDLEEAGIVSPSTSNFASPAIIVPKKNDPSIHEVTYRMVIDFRKINKQPKYWSYPLMRKDRIFSKVLGTKLISTLDIQSAYYNISMSKIAESTLPLLSVGEHLPDHAYEPNDKNLDVHYLTCPSK